MGTILLIVAGALVVIGLIVFLIIKLKKKPTPIPTPIASQGPAPTPSATPTTNPPVLTKIFVTNAGNMNYNVTSVRVDGQMVTDNSFPVLPGETKLFSTDVVGTNLDVKVNLNGAAVGGEFVTVVGVDNICEEVMGGFVDVSGTNINGTPTTIYYGDYCF
jgi:hypothetical protein